MHVTLQAVGLIPKTFLKPLESTGFKWGKSPSERDIPALKHSSEQNTTISGVTGGGGVSPALGQSPLDLMTLRTQAPGVPGWGQSSPAEWELKAPTIASSKRVRLVF